MQIPRLREWRETRALSQVELAELADLSSRSVAGYEAGAGARPATVRRLAEALGVEVTDLRGDAEHPLEEAPPSSQLTLNGALEEERREPIYQHALRDYITLRARSIADQAESKDYYAPAWMLEVDAIPRELTRILFDNGILGNRETYPTEAEYRGSCEIADALTELEHAVDRAWRTQMRVSERMERQREAAAELDSIWKRSKEASRSSKEALEAIRQERSESA